MSNRIFKGAEEISVILNRVTKLLKNTLAKEFSLNNVYYHKKLFQDPFVLSKIKEKPYSYSMSNVLYMHEISISVMFHESSERKFKYKVE